MWSKCGFIFDDTRGLSATFFRFLSFSERRDGSSGEHFQIYPYLEQLRRPGAEAVGLAQVERAEVGVEGLVDLMTRVERGGGLAGAPQ